MSWRTEMKRLARKSFAELDALSTELLHRRQTPYVRRRQQQITYAIAAIEARRKRGHAGEGGRMPDNSGRFTDEELMGLGARIGEYMGQERWLAEPRHGGVIITDPARPGFAVSLRDSWPRGRLCCDGATVYFKDGEVYHTSWSYCGVEISVDPKRGPQVIANEIRRRLLPKMEERYLEICSQRAQFIEDVRRSREARAWAGKLLARYDPNHPPLEEKQFPLHGSHELWLRVGTRTFKIGFSYSGWLAKVQVEDIDFAFVEAILELHERTQPPLLGWWRQFDIEDNAPMRRFGREANEGGEIRGDFTQLTELHREIDARFYKLQVRLVGQEDWHDWSPQVALVSAQTAP